MNEHCDVQNTIVIDEVKAIEARGEYLIITGRIVGKRVAIKNSEIAAIVNYAIRHYRLKVIESG